MTTPFRDHAKSECGTCDGPITYYARKADDPKPRTAAIDDANRWAHDRLDDAIRAPHRATPKQVA